MLSVEGDTVSVQTEEKAVDLVGKGKVKITTRTDDVTSGEVEGDHGTYKVTIDPSGSWCSCAHGTHRNPHAECSHVLAIKIETVRLGG
jgi:hypothetical protein